MIEIDKIYVVCEYCGTANLFTNIKCSECDGKLKIEFRITMNYEEESFSGYQTDMAKRIRHVFNLEEEEEEEEEEYKETELTRLAKKEQQLEIISQVTKSIRPRSIIFYGKLYFTIILAIMVAIFIYGNGVDLTILFNNTISTDIDFNSLITLLMPLFPLLILVIMVKKLKEI